MKKHGYIFLLLILQLFIYLPTISHAATESKTKILVLYKERDPDHEVMVNFFTGFLEQTGFEYDTGDVEQLLIEKPDMTPYSGILSCYQTSQMLNADLYPYWLVEQMESGRRILIMGNYGAYQGIILKSDGSYLQWNESTQVINTFFYPFGLEFYFAFTNDTEKLRIVKADKEYAQFQMPVLPEDLNYYQLFKSVNPDNRIYFELERTDMLDSRSALNVITPFGGMIIEGYAYSWDPDKKEITLRVNLSKFIEEVFSAKSPKVPKYNIASHSELMTQNPLPMRQPPESWKKLQPTEFSRRILVPYKESEVKSLLDFHVFKRAALVLEYLGMIPVYWAVEDGLPDDEFMDNFRGIVSWHTKPYMYHAREYGNWLLRQIKKGKRVVILQEYGATYDSETQEPVSNQVDVFRALGIQFVMRSGRRMECLPEVRIADENMFGFEREFDPSHITFETTYTSINSQNEVFLSYNDNEYGVADLGIITPNGGICMGAAPYYFPGYDAELIELYHKAIRSEVSPDVADKTILGAWFINPYSFFSKALDLEGLPTPDITTLNGSRIFYAHIDADAFESVSPIDRAHLAGFFVYEEILKKYIDVPIAVSVLTKFIEERGNQYYRPTIELARKIFALPNVEVAVHSATHPYNWVAGDLYITNPGDYPYRIGYKQPDLVEEIWGAKLFAERNLAPADKKTEVILWSGATNPDANALEIAWRSGMHNLNGGDPRYDDEYPSLEHACPYSIPKGSYRQYLTSAQNDYGYSFRLRGDWGDHKKVVKHYQKTDEQYRIMPMNLYYHFYAGLRNDSLDALCYIYDYIRSTDAATIYASQYLEIAEDYYNTHVGFDGGTYWVDNSGYLRTVRFNNIVHVNMKLSEGVIGYCHHNDQTYIHLDGSKRRKIILADSPPKVPYLIQATLYVDKFDYNGSTLNIILRGFGKVFLKIGGLIPANDYKITIEAPGREMIRASIKTDKDGVLEYRNQLPSPSTSYKVILTVEEAK